MEQGKKYRVTWKMTHQRRLREFVGVFLSTYTNGHYAFSLRPSAGTIEMTPAEIVQCVPVPDNTPVGVVKR